MPENSRHPLSPTRRKFFRNGVPSPQSNTMVGLNANNISNPEHRDDKNPEAKNNCKYVHNQSNLSKTKGAKPELPVPW